jgi:predicted dehydrogenase
MKKLRWGILGAANIARRNWKALFHSGNGTLVAVAARDHDRARRFIRDGQAQFAFDPAPEALGSYDQLLAIKDIDAVYIPLPTRLRKEWVVRAAAAGKHVLCEKPCAVNAADLREMLATCRRNGVQFMDGVMFMHNPRLAALRAVMDDNQRIGPIRRIMSFFSFNGGEPQAFQSNIRVQGELEPAGCLGDLGWYCLRISLFAQHWQMPQFASGRILTAAADGKTPTQFSGELIFPQGTSAGFYCAFVVEGQQWVTVSGQRGTVRVSDFVHPANTYEPSFEINRTEYRVPADTGSEVPMAPGALADFGHPTAQDARMFRNFAAQALSGRTNPDWPEIALKTQLVMDACLASARAESRLVKVEPI